ncbi:hypothetical protein ColTof4_01091 [Colletotrichum tofieldiae]|nr:hypothetical protein ColTof3_08313 [Colletotrichum tofieldiae]GKT68668.1 hypothetical protein ColTof4_01091 [Colletotrichum tofieldiae]
MVENNHHHKSADTPSPEPARIRAEQNGIVAGLLSQLHLFAFFIDALASIKAKLRCVAQFFCLSEQEMLLDLGPNVCIFTDALKPSPPSPPVDVILAAIIDGTIARRHNPQVTPVVTVSNLTKARKRLRPDIFLSRASTETSSLPGEGNSPGVVDSPGV